MASLQEKNTTQTRSAFFPHEVLQDSHHGMAGMEIGRMRAFAERLRVAKVVPCHLKIQWGPVGQDQSFVFSSSLNFGGICSLAFCQAVDAFLEAQGVQELSCASVGGTLLAAMY